MKKDNKERNKQNLKGGLCPGTPASTVHCVSHHIINITTYGNVSFHPNSILNMTILALISSYHINHFSFPAIITNIATSNKLLKIWVDASQNVNIILYVTTSCNLVYKCYFNLIIIALTMPPSVTYRNNTLILILPLSCNSSLLNIKPLSTLQLPYIRNMHSI